MALEFQGKIPKCFTGYMNMGINTERYMELFSQMIERLQNNDG